VVPEPEFGHAGGSGAVEAAARHRLDVAAEHAALLQGVHVDRVLHRVFGAVPPAAVTEAIAAELGS